MLSMDQLSLAGKRVLIREDLNVPLRNGRVANDARLRAAVPTIEAAVAAGAGVILMSHLGRPVEGEASEEFSLSPVADALCVLRDCRSRSSPSGRPMLQRQVTSGC